ncbi:substrate-binding domain-containing protein [Paraburkholderia sp. PREW-6R]|uniref:substrate-binding domain-containing protein n=1 Tax=Paraburkholderia sp. PREW-6R TaxID=3141544 RepID=UPI0031F4C0A5
MVIGHTVSGPITGISSMATRGVLAELADEYARSSGQRVMIESVGGVDAAQRVQNGEAFDFVVLAAGAINRLEDAGRVLAGSRVDLARSGVAIAVAAGAPQPDISTEAALRSAVLAARSIGFSTGPSGLHLACLFERWGIADTVGQRIVQAPPGVPVGELIARGEVELGFQQLSELIDLPGIDVIGPMPGAAQTVTVFSAGICTTSQQKESAGTFLSFLASSRSDAAKLSHGMEPVQARL